MSGSADPAGAGDFAFQAETSRLLDIVIHSLYSHREIFLRELLSNAADALDRLRFLSVTDPEILGQEPALEIRILPDSKARTLTIEDTGIGMSREELVQNLGTIAHSGTRRFLEGLAGKPAAAPELIGQFGVGFYSAFIVADRVVVRSRPPGADGSFQWSSDGRSGFRVEPGPADAPRGTSLVLHLREDAREFLDEDRLRELVRRYSDYLAFPVRLLVDPKKEDGFETVNRASAPWRRSKKDLTPEEAAAFYRHLVRDFEDPLEAIHIQLEGALEYQALLFIPRRAPPDLFAAEGDRGVRLYVKRVFIMEDCEQILPPWLRFVRGVVDANDLPLNVSRELLQADRLSRQIRASLTGRVLGALEKMAANRPEDYAVFSREFGTVLKEGFHYEPERAGALAPLLRFPSSRGGEAGLAEYVARMPSGQEAIHYVQTPGPPVGEGSPHAEALRARGFEVLFLTEPIDEWVLAALPEFEGKPLRSALRADLDLPGEAPVAGPGEEALLAAARKILADRVADVRLSRRLVESPACLVVPEGGLNPHLERLLRARHAELPTRKRVLELNPGHPLVKRLAARVRAAPGDPAAAEWVELLHDQALLAEGSPIADPHKLARRVADLLMKTIPAD
jgi:molecular chaperone HtpG